MPRPHVPVPFVRGQALLLLYIRQVVVLDVLLERHRAFRSRGSIIVRPKKVSGQSPRGLFSSVQTGCFFQLLALLDMLHGTGGSDDAIVIPQIPIGTLLEQITCLVATSSFHLISFR